MKMTLKHSAAIAVALLGIITGSPVLAQDDPPKADLLVGPDGQEPSTPGPKKADFRFRTVSADTMRQPNKEMPWLGVGLQEADEPLAAQLGLKTGEGLVVSYVATNSPAADAGIQKNDVLVDLDGQMLVDSVQFRKLIQMHADGDSVKLEFYHAGKRMSVNVKLAMHKFVGASMDGEYTPFGSEKQFLFTPKLPNLPDFDTTKLSTQFQLARDQAGRAMDEAKRAVEEAMRQSFNGTDGVNHKLWVIQQKLGDLANGGVNLHNDATVVVKNEGGPVRTMVKKDDSGTYVIVADPAKHLTAHDVNGKLLFDGPIDSVDQQQKVAPEVWKKAQPMLDQLNSNSPDADGDGAHETHPNEQ